MNEMPIVSYLSTQTNTGSPLQMPEPVIPPKPSLLSEIKEWFSGFYGFVFAVWTIFFILLALRGVYFLIKVSIG